MLLVQWKMKKISSEQLLMVIKDILAIINDDDFIKNSIKINSDMENRKKRGLSLTHQQPTTANDQRSLEKSSLPMTTRLNCSLYPISYTVRMPSAPKTKVQFSYPQTHSPSIHIPPPQTQISHVSVLRTSCVQPYKKFTHSDSKENQQPVKDDRSIPS